MAEKAWVITGTLVALGITIMIVRELPAIRRELRILRM
jgi:hypothetical protein